MGVGHRVSHVWRREAERPLNQDSAVPSSRRTRSCAVPANRRPSARQRNQLGRRPGSQQEGVGPFACTSASCRLGSPGARPDGRCGPQPTRPVAFPHTPSSGAPWGPVLEPLCAASHRPSPGRWLGPRCPRPLPCPGRPAPRCRALHRLPAGARGPCHSREFIAKLSWPEFRGWSTPSPAAARLAFRAPDGCNRPAIKNKPGGTGAGPSIKKSSPAPGPGAGDDATFFTGEKTK